MKTVKEMKTDRIRGILSMIFTCFTMDSNVYANVCPIGLIAFSYGISACLNKLNSDFPSRAAGNK